MKRKNKRSVSRSSKSFKNNWRLILSLIAIIVVCAIVVYGSLNKTSNKSEAAGRRSSSQKAQLNCARKFESLNSMGSNAVGKEIYFVERPVQLNTNPPDCGRNGYQFHNGFMDGIKYGLCCINKDDYNTISNKRCTTRLSMDTNMSGISSYCLSNCAGNYIHQTYDSAANPVRCNLAVTDNNKVKLITGSCCY